MALALAASGGCLWFFVDRVWEERTKVVETLGRADYLYVLLAVGFLAVLYWFRIRRWKLFLEPIKSVRILSVADATLIGFMANCLLPFRLGEVVRPYVLHRREGIRFGTCLATTAALERPFDMAGLGGLVILAIVLLRGRLPVSETASGHVQVALAVFAAMAAAAVGGVAWLALAPKSFLRVGQLLTRALPEHRASRADGFLRALVDGMRFVRTRQGVGLALVYSLGLWVAQGVSTYWLALGLGMENFSMAGAFVAVTAVAIAVAAPQAPAFIGPFQGAALVAAELFGAGRGEAGAFAILMWAVNVLPITLVGLVFLWREGLNLKTLASAASKMKDAAGSHADAGGGGV